MTSRRGQAGGTVPGGRALIAALLMVVSGCSGGDDGVAGTETTTAQGQDPSSTVPATTLPSTTTTTTVPATTTSTTVPGGPPLIVEGDRNETVEAFQFLLNCSAFGELEIDGVFGPATLAAVEAAQTSLGREVNGAPDDDTFAELARRCDRQRRLDGEGEVTVVGNAASDDPERFAVALLSDTTLTVTLTDSSAVTASLLDSDGDEVEGDGEWAWAIDGAGDFELVIAAGPEAVTFSILVAVSDTERPTGDWILGTSGISYRGTTLSHGADAQTVIDQVFEFLGHGVRGAYDEFDTEWYTITEPGDMGLRGVFIEGFALLFFGPDPNNPDRPETFVRHRFVGSGLDAAGEPRPEDYATTAEGITVGDTLADLRAAYGDAIRSGSNPEEHYMRFADGGGELCFYFGAEEPSEFAPILEIASECRTG